MNINWNDIVNQTIAQIIAAVAIFILSLFVLDQKKIIRPWVYKYFNNSLKWFFFSILKLIDIFSSLPARIIIAILLVILISIYHNIYYSVILTILILSFFMREKKHQTFLPASDFSDKFENLVLWNVIRGAPIIEHDFGKPVPDLNLKFIGDNPTNSLIFHKKIEATQGTIECDFYLEPHSVFNIVFFADKEKEKWFMARFDCRPGESDGFLIKGEGVGQQNWNYYKMSGTTTSVHEWHRARIVIKDKKILLYKNDNLLVELKDEQSFGKHVGMFNEVNDVHVDNFTFTKNLWN